MQSLPSTLSLAGENLQITTHHRLGQRIQVEIHTVYLPAPRLTTCFGIPTPKKLNYFSYCCHAAAATTLVGGVVTLGYVANSDLPVGPKAGICVVAGLIMLLPYYCCKLSTDYGNMSITVRQFIDPSCYGYRWWQTSRPAISAYDALI